MGAPGGSVEKGSACLVSPAQGFRSTRAMGDLCEMGSSGTEAVFGHTGTPDTSLVGAAMALAGAS